MDPVITLNDSESLKLNFYSHLVTPTIVELSFWHLPLAKSNKTHQKEHFVVLHMSAEVFARVSAREKVSFACQDKNQPNK